jgi:hypothetical protein
MGNSSEGWSGATGKKRTIQRGSNLFQNWIRAINIRNTDIRVTCGDLLHLSFIDMQNQACREYKTCFYRRKLLVIYPAIHFYQVNCKTRSGPSVVSIPIAEDTNQTVSMVLFGSVIILFLPLVCARISPSSAQFPLIGNRALLQHQLPMNLRLWPVIRSWTVRHLSLMILIPTNKLWTCSRTSHNIFIYSRKYLRLKIQLSWVVKSPIFWEIIQHNS